MDIPGKAPLYALQVHNPNKDGHQCASSAEPGPKHAESDTVALSANVGQIREAVRSLNSMPDVREDKVAAMKRRIESGIYRIAGEKVAANLIGETMENNDILNHIDGGRD